MMITRAGTMAALVLAAVGLTAACDGSSDDMTGTPGGSVVEVQLTSSLTFSPETVTIEPGTTVRWVNDSGLFHTVTPDGHSEFADTDMPSGETFEHTFDTEGTFPYYCEPHLAQGMTGEVVVQSGDGGPTY